MPRLNKPNRKGLTKKDFEKYQLWVWDDENEGHLPISDSKYTSKYGTLFIKAFFECENCTFDGYLIGFDVFYAFGLFVNKKEIPFNVNMTSFARKHAREIFAELNCKPFDLFPLKYTSPIDFDDGTPISGKFILDKELRCVPDAIPETATSLERITEKLLRAYGKIK